MEHTLKSKSVTVIIIAVFYVVLMFVLYWVDIAWHEQTHYSIAENYGCIRGNISFNPLGDGGKYVCLEYSNRTMETKRTERLLHSYNEIIGYNNTTLMIAIVMAAFAISMTIVLLSGS